MLVFGGGLFAYRNYKQNRPHPMWVPLPINPELPVEKQDKIAKELKQKLCQKEVLAQVSKDLGLTNEWKLSSDEKCADELLKRIFVDVGMKDTPLGRVPSINIGIRGKEKESELSGKISMRLMKDVMHIIKPPSPTPEF